MGKRFINVNSGANLAALLKAFPDAKVDTLIAEPGRDSWRLTIETPDQLEVPKKGTCEQCGDEVADVDALTEMGGKKICVHCIKSFRDFREDLADDEPPEEVPVLLVMRVEFEDGKREWWLTDGTRYHHGRTTQQAAMDSWNSDHGYRFNVQRVKGIINPTQAQEASDKLK